MKTRPPYRVYVAGPAAAGPPCLRQRLVRPAPATGAMRAVVAGPALPPPRPVIGGCLAEALAYLLGFDVVAAIEFVLAV